MNTLLSNNISISNSFNSAASIYIKGLDSLDGKIDGKIDGKMAATFSKAALNTYGNFAWFDVTFPAIRKSINLIIDEIISRSTSTMTIDDIYNMIKFVAAKCLILTMYLFFLYNLFIFFILKIINSKYLYIFYLIISLIVLIGGFVYMILFFQKPIPNLSEEDKSLRNIVAIDALFIYGFPLIFFMYMNYVEMRKMNSRIVITKKNNSAR